MLVWARRRVASAGGTFSAITLVSVLEQERPGSDVAVDSSPGNRGPERPLFVSASFRDIVALRTLLGNGRAA